jgi:hypothetical protein
MYCTDINLDDVSDFSSLIKQGGFDHVDFGCSKGGSLDFAKKPLAEFVAWVSISLRLKWKVRALQGLMRFVTTSMKYQRRKWYVLWYCLISFPGVDHKAILKKMRYHHTFVDEQGKRVSPINN